MAGNRAAIKARIKSINTTKKITGAMELISSVKLQRNRNRLEQTSAYAGAIKKTVSQILDSEESIDSRYLHRNDVKSSLYFVFCSDMGLCGAYNMNISKLGFENIKKDDYVIMIGTKLYPLFKRNGYQILNKPISSDRAEYRTIKKWATQAINYFEEGRISSINVLYTEFVNNVSFRPCISEALPCTVEKEEHVYKEVLFEPDPSSILGDLIPLMVENDIYERFMESKTSEHGSRRFAMENATSNANDLNDKLLLEYNQARQAAITSEITEIVAGADAL